MQYFCYKLQTIQRVEGDVIVNYAVTTASVHYSHKDPTFPGIFTNKDRGYFSVGGKDIDATIERTVRRHKIPI